MFENILTEELLTLIADIIQRSEEAGQRASGRTYEAITPEVTSTPQSTTGKVWAPVYFSTLIRGRGPGPIPRDMEEIIKEWAGYKGLTFESIEDLNRFARAVAWTIRRDGSELYRNHLYVDIVDTPIRDFENRLQVRIGDLIGVLITRSLGADGTANHGYII